MMPLLLFWDSIFIVLPTIANVNALILDVVFLTSKDNGIVKSVVIAVVSVVVVFAVIVVVFIVLPSHSTSFPHCPVAFSINFNKDYNRKSI